MVFFWITIATPQAVIVIDSGVIKPVSIARVDPTHEPHEAANPTEASGDHVIGGGLIERFSVYMWVGYCVPDNPRALYFALLFC